MKDILLAFNSMSCALAEVDDNFKHIYDKIENIELESLNEQEKKLVNDMKYGNYIISDDTDETRILKFRNSNGKDSKDFISFVLAPTIACNFACPYCYESAKQGFMSQEVQDKLVELVENAAKQKRRVDITWYGGEPLLAKKIIETLSQKFIKLCDENEVNYYASIITNGYLINQEDNEMFKNCRIRTFQITIDGPRDIHNTRRILKVKNAEGTFDKIISNVKLLLENNLNVAIRVNIDKTNIERTRELIEYLKEEGLTEAFVDFGHVTACSDSNQDIKCDCLSTQEYALQTLELQEYLFRNGFHVGYFPYYPGIKANYCGADSISTYVIDPEGYKYKCWNEVGNILWSEDDYTETMVNREMFYMTWSPFESVDCMECNLLPICMGGVHIQQSVESQENVRNGNMD